MVGYMLEEQVDKDFSLARSKALLRRIGARLRRDAASDGLLLCFDDVRKHPGIVRRVYRGTRTMPVGQIWGSVGRCSEFDRDFMPARASMEEKWKRIDRAFWRGEELPPVSLYIGRRLLLRFGWPPPRKRGLLPRGCVDRRLCDGV